jgi:hypothetical protein
VISALICDRHRRCLIQLSAGRATLLFAAPGLIEIALDTPAVPRATQLARTQIGKPLHFAPE